MPRKTRVSPRSAETVSSVSVIKTKRGRPRTPYAPDALLPFKKNEVTTLEKFESKSQLVKKTPKHKRTNPATSHRDYTVDEIEFMNALAQFKQTSGHFFPTCSEILAVVKELGYEKAR